MSVPERPWNRPMVARALDAATVRILEEAWYQWFNRPMYPNRPRSSELRGLYRDDPIGPRLDQDRDW